MNKYMTKFSDEQKNKVFAHLTESRNESVRAWLRKYLTKEEFADALPGSSAWIEGCIACDSDESRWVTDRARFSMLGYVLPDGDFRPDDDLDDAIAWCEAAEAAYADWGDRLLGRQCDGVERDPRHWRMVLNTAMNDPAPCVAPDGGSTQILDFRNSIVKEATDSEGKVFYTVEAGQNQFTQIMLKADGGWPGPIAV